MGRLLLAVACAASVAVAGEARAAAPLSAAAMYADAQAKEAAVRRVMGLASSREALAKAVPAVVRSYEALVRQYPSSGYSDDALWNAARLALEASERSGDRTYEGTAVRLLQQLASQYPASKHARQVPATLARLDAGPSAIAVRDERVERPSEGAVAPQTTAPPVSPRPAASSTTTVAQRPAELATLHAVHRSVLPDVVRITLELDAEAPFRHEELTNPARLFFDLSATKASPELRDRTIRFDGDQDVVRQVRIGRQPNETTRVVIETAGVASCSASPTYTPYRLVVDCVRSAARKTTSQLATVTRPTPRTPSTLARKVPTAAPAPLGARSTVSPMAIPAALFARTTMPPFARALPAGRPLFAAAELEAAATESTANASPPSLANTARGRVPAAATALPAPPPLAPVPATAPSAPPATASKNLGGGLSMARQLGLNVSRIVIDPGHGGHDPGARNKGISEAELVLDIALRLEALLQAEPGVEVILTRRADVFVPLEERTALANRESADLFLSIHANASPTSRAAGIETYFLNFANTAGAAAVAARENAASGQPMRALPDFVKAIALNNKMDESRDFATLLQRSLTQKLKAANKDVKDLGVKQAPFVVLIGAAMPSVLSEVSFVTNDREARLLRTSAYRQRIAEALFAGVRKYQSSLAHETALAQR